MPGLLIALNSPGGRNIYNKAFALLPIIMCGFPHLAFSAAGMAPYGGDNIGFPLGGRLYTLRFLVLLNVVNLAGVDYLAAECCG